LENIFYLTF